ncbi:MAG: flavin reductase family protein [Clostridia bacterium]|nr:flavin reductase family protein [Clostridia bacterium]
MARQNFKAGTLLAPLPAVMVSVGRGEEKNIITVAWCGILSSDPPRAYISVRPSRHSHKMLKETGEFVINLTTEDLALATDYSGIYTGAKVDKFKKCSLTAIPSKCVSAPTIEESPLSLECRVFEVMESGTHDIFMADILNVSCDEKILDEKGRICYDKAGLIAYSHGEYFSLGKKIGRFGYSTDKKSKSRLQGQKNSRKPSSKNTVDRGRHKK